MVNSHGEAEWINKDARGEIKTKWHVRYEQTISQILFETNKNKTERSLAFVSHRLL